ncbi:MAG TPA: ABC transporter substrate-binding protein [Thermomicrobiales bacterium]|nr:ABC transporter substrate-binding protein [Thermomicrobiales bacterium]
MSRSDRSAVAGHARGASRVSRREFVRRATLLGLSAPAVAALLAACGGANPTPTSAPVSSTAAPTANSAPAASAAPTAATGGGATAAPTVVATRAGAAATPTAAATSAAAGGGQPKPGGTSVWAAETDPVALNPITNSNFSSTQGFEHSYESLTAYTPDLKIVPALAESWDNPDQTTYVFHLRKNVKWHDGTDFTADDVKYTFDIVLDPKGPAVYRQNFDQVDKVEVVDPLTVKFTTKAPFPPLLGAFAILRSSAIIPKGAMEKGKLDTQVVGTGPYKLTEYVPSDHITLVKNKDYWGGPLPYIDNVTFKILAQEDARIAGLRAGTLDYGVLSADGRQRLQGDSKFHIGSVPRQYNYLILFNMTKPPFSDAKARQAVNLAIDRKEIADKVFSGVFTPCGPVPISLGGGWALPADELATKWEKYDPNQAKQLLKDAGVDTSQELDFLVTPFNNNFVPLAVVVADQLKKVGLNAKIRQVEQGVYIKEQKANNFALTPNAATARHDPDAYVYSFHSGQNSAAGFKDDQLDALMEQARTTLDAAKRKDLYDQIQRQMLTDAAAVWLGVDNYIEALQTYVQGYVQSPSSRRIALKSSWLAK